MNMHAPTDDDRMILDSVDRFLDRDVAPHVHRLEHDDIWPAEIVDKMRELGLFGAMIGTVATIIDRVSMNMPRMK